MEMIEEMARVAVRSHIDGDSQDGLTLLTHFTGRIGGCGGGGGKPNALFSCSIEANPSNRPDHHAVVSLPETEENFVAGRRPSWGWGAFRRRQRPRQAAAAADAAADAAAAANPAAEAADSTAAGGDPPAAGPADPAAAAADTDAEAAHPREAAVGWGR